jgi:hypothetical protein
LRDGKIGYPGEVKLGCSGTIEMRFCGEGGADRENYGKRKDGDFDFFHTRLFLFELVIGMVFKRFRR